MMYPITRIKLTMIDLWANFANCCDYFEIKINYEIMNELLWLFWN